MARITLSFLLLALALAAQADHLSTRTRHPGADVLGWSDAKRSTRLGLAGAAKAVSAGPQRRAQGGKKRAPDASQARALEPVPVPAKRTLNTPSDPSKLAVLKVERAHPEFGTDLAGRGLHPHIFLQQHINRGVRRHARMRGRDLGDLDAQFEESIRKRWIGIHGHDHDLVLRKRSRAGLALADVTAPAADAAAPAGALNQDVADEARTAGFSQKDLKALEDNTVTAPQTPTAKNSLGLSIEADDVGYFATVQAGTPPKNYKILMDSGSADFWVPGEACTTCGDHTTLGAKTSSSFVNTKAPFEVTYGTGAVKGVKIQDNVAIAGLKLANHSFGVTTAETEQFGSNSVPFDGLMGLAQSTLSEEKVDTPIESLAKQGTVAAAQMGFALGSVDAATNIGEITFGGVDQTKFNGDLTLFKNVNTEGFWEGAMDDVTVDGKSVGLKGRTSILDTGTTLIVAPPADAAAVHKAIPGAKADGQGGFTVPCTTSAKVALTFGGKAFEINPANLAFQPVNTNDLKGDCVSGISSGEIGGATEWLSGDVFLRSQYFATDENTNEIGLAPIKAAQS